MILSVCCARPCGSNGGVKIIGALSKSTHEGQQNYLIIIELAIFGQAAPNDCWEEAAINYSQYYRMNKILEEHVIKLQIQIKELLFRVVRPNKVSFSISLDGKTLSQTRKNHTVDGDRCLLFEKHTCELNANFDPKKTSYLSKQLTLLIHYEGLMGRDGRKYVKFDPLSKGSGQQEWRLPAQGTSDFQIQFATSFNVLSKKSKSSQLSSNAEDPYLHGKIKREFSADRKTSAINELIRTEGDIKRESLVQENFTNKTRKLQNLKSVPIDSKKRGIKNRVASPKYAEESDETAKPKDELENLRKKIELEREQKVRSISKLKMEISPNFLGQIEKNEDNIQTGKLKEKIRNFQRKEKNFLTNIQELNAELQRKKQKIHQLDGKRQDLEKAISDRDIKLKAAQSTIRTLNEHIDSINTKQKTSNRKGEAKEAALREQIRKLEEKMRLADVQIAKYIEQKSSTIKSVQFCQKIHQNALKQKDIKISQEKSKLSKLKQQFLIKQKELNFALQQLTLKAESLEYEKNQAEQRISILNQNIFNLQTELAAFKQSIKLERLENERRMEEKSDKAFGDINNARIKFNDLTTENNLLKQKVKRLQALKAQNDCRIKELQENLKVKNSELNKIMGKINGFKQDLDSLNEESLRKTREIQGLKQANNSLKLKLTESKERYEEQRSRKDEANETLERQANEFNKREQSYQLQIKDLKWTIVRHNDSIAELQYQLKEQNNVILKLNEDNMSKTQKNSALEENLRQIAHQSGQFESQNNGLNIKVKELNQIIKLKNLEIDEQRKLRNKAEQKIEDEKQKNRQIMNFNRQRQIQEEERHKQKEAIITRKQEEISSFELEITKRRQQITSLKNSFQSVLREIQLSKMDNDTVKSELNLMESNYKALKLQHSNLLKAQQALSISLASTEESLAVQIKKYQQLQKDFDQYKQAIERALQNLLVQLFKQQTNSSNIIAATLFPFPTQKLSNLQIQLVQKRNSFIIKSRQKLSDLQNKVDLLEHQLQELTQLYERREEATKRQDTQQREKLKGLLYQNMLEKNHLNEDLVIERKQREQIEKEVEKLKGQIFRREDIEQQLHGQLQMMLLQYEGVKAENQDLSSLLFKHKEMEIKTTSDFEQRITLLQEQSTGQNDKLKVEGLEKEKKIIELEKDILELNQKIRKIQDQKLKINGVLELSKQSNRIIEEKNSFSNIEITKLNNSIKNLEKREASYRDTIDKLESEILQLRNKCEVLQSSLNMTTSEHFQVNLEKEKVIGQLTNLKQRCSQLEKVLHEKGEVSKERIQKKMEEISQLKSNLIQKTSELELKQFHIKQKQQQNQTLNQENQQLKKANLTFKTRLKELINSLQSSESKIKDLTRDIEQMVQERVKKDDILSQSNFFIMSLQNQLEEMNHLSLAVQAKQKQCIQLREAKSETQQYYMNQLKKNKETINSLKKEIRSNRANLENLEDEYKESLEALSKTNNQRCKSLEADFLLQKDDFSKRVEEIDAHNKRVISQYEFRIEKLKEDLEDSKESERNLIEEGQKKEAVIKNLTKKYQQIEGQLDEFKQKYNRYYHLYLENKAELGQNLKENQSKLMNTMEKSKISQLKQYTFKLAQLQRKLQRLRHSEEMQLKTQTLSRREIKFLLDRIFQKLGQYIKQAQIEADELWEASRIDSHLI